MESNELNILVISFYFPPYKRVGGRRWAKHCKYLNRLGINTFVLTGEFPNSVSSWDKDITEYCDNVYRIKLKEGHLPYFKTKLPSGFIDKIKWKLSLLKWNFTKKKLKGNYNDVSVNAVNDFCNKAILIIESKSINTVILSVGPFRYSEILVILKNKYPEIKFVIDYRDYWEDGYADLSPKQISYENKIQTSVVDSVDLILTPNMDMKKHYSVSFNKNTFCLAHCFDKDEILENNALQNTSVIKLLYGGAFYSNISENIDLIKKLIDGLTLKLPVIADFYVSIKGYEKELEHSLIKRFDFIDTEEYFLKVHESNYVILILPPNRVNAMSSKFFELVALRKPILYFGGEGEVSEYLIKQRLGYHVTSTNLNKLVDVIYNNIQSQQIPDKNYDISQHSFEHHTKLLVDKLKSL